MKEPQVYLVGAGPGDPELLTVKAQRLIMGAQTLVFDRLISKEILRLAPRSCSQIYVGKSTDRHTLPQGEINKLLVNLAKNGQTVVRLKGGDPGIFGRVGEEADALSLHNIPYEIVPGITAAQASASALGIALTHRDYAPKLTLISGHRMHNRPFSLDESELIDPNQTLVVYMGVSSAGTLSTQLLEAGRETDTPVALIERVSSPEQRVFLTTLVDLSDTIEYHQIKPPALIIVSKVIATCSRYSFESEVTDIAEKQYG
jgi:uroporphyrin-III C-methyltransferase